MKKKNYLMKYFVVFLPSSCNFGPFFDICTSIYLSMPPPFLVAQVHAALFASVEAGGSAQLWDLNSNIEVIFATLPTVVI